MTETMDLPLEPLHRARGARFSEPTPWRRPLFYGENGAAAEYGQAREHAALVDLSDRGLLRVTGPPRMKFLQGLLSQDVASRAAGTGCHAALMDAKGRLLAFMRVSVAADEVILELPRERVGPIEELLQYYRVAAPVRFARDDGAVLAVLGPEATRILPDAPETAEAHATHEIAGAAVRIVRATDLPVDGFVLHVPAEAAPGVWEELERRGAKPAGRHALDALRVEAGRPWYGADVGPENLLHETGEIARYHSATKGCYVGQEVIARLEARGGHVNKHLRGLRLSQPAVSGAVIGASGAEVGRVTTAAVSPRFGPIAMGYLHRDHANPGSLVTVDGAPATVAALPLGD